MKKFILNIIMFSLPIIGLMFMETLLPPTFFSFRTWEGISFSTKIPHIAKSYPNSKTQMDATGDLCHHSDKAIIKSELWITDKLGFRNNEFVEEADILFIGDSFFSGVSLSQDEIISNLVKSKFNQKIEVYNMSPISFSRFIYYLNNGIIKKPKLIIFSIVERNVPESINSFHKSALKSKIYKIFQFGNANKYLDKAFRFSSIRWLKARIYNTTGFGIKSVDSSNMFFLQSTSQKHEKNDLKTSEININAYKRYCDSLNIKFIFMPMPDKETVYFERVPFNKQPDYLFQLDSLLNNDGITTINTLKIYNEYRKNHDNLLYQLDDTHWNSNATELMSQEIFSVINKDKNNLSQ